MRLSHRFNLLAVLAAVVIAGCTARGTEAAPRRDNTVITQDELQDARAINAYELVRALRPGWLRVRGTTTLSYREQVIVYVNEVRMGGEDVLRQLRPEAIQSMRYLDEVNATARYGGGHSAGAILVTLLVGT
jgi:hypothetical protein